VEVPGHRDDSGCPDPQDRVGSALGALNGDTHHMNTRPIIGVLMMIVGFLLILSSPWLVLSFGPMHHHVFDEGWALLTTGQCVWFSELKTPALIGWLSTLMVFGIATSFAGLWLFRSARFHRINFREDHAV